MRTVRDAVGDRTGFSGQRYRTEHLGTQSFADTFDDYLAFLAPRFSICISNHSIGPEVP